MHSRVRTRLCTHEVLGTPGATGTGGPGVRWATGTGAATGRPDCCSGTATGKVLLQRAVWSHYGGTWGLLGGARNSGETAEQAAGREAAEEAGLESSSYTVVGRYVDDHGGWSYTTVIACSDRATLPNALTAETVEVRWVRWVGWTSCRCTGVRHELGPGADRRPGQHRRS